MSCTIWLNCLDKMTIIDLHPLSGTERQKDNNNSIVFETFNRVESSIYERHNVLIHGSKTRYIPKSKLDRVNNLLNCMCENNRQIIKRRHLYDIFVVNDNDNNNTPTLSSKTTAIIKHKETATKNFVRFFIHIMFGKIHVKADQIFLQSAQRWEFELKLMEVVLENRIYRQRRLDILMDVAIACYIAALANMKIYNGIKSTATSITSTAATNTATFGIESAAQVVGNAMAGAAISAIVDVAVSSAAIYVAKRQKDEGRITEKEFNIKIKKTVCESSCKFVGGTTGSIIGQAVIPVPVVGALIGGFCGSLIGAGIGKGINYGVFDRKSKKSRYENNQNGEDIDKENSETKSKQFNNIQKRYGRKIRGHVPKIVYFDENTRQFKEKSFPKSTPNFLRPVEASLKENQAKVSEAVSETQAKVSEAHAKVSEAVTMKPYLNKWKNRAAKPEGEELSYGVDQSTAEGKQLSVLTKWKRCISPECRSTLRDSNEEAVDGDENNQLTISSESSSTTTTAETTTPPISERKQLSVLSKWKRCVSPECISTTPDGSQAETENDKLNNREKLPTTATVTRNSERKQLSVLSKWKRCISPDCKAVPSESKEAVVDDNGQLTQVVEHKQIEKASEYNANAKDNDLHSIQSPTVQPKKSDHLGEQKSNRASLSPAKRGSSKQEETPNKNHLNDQAKDQKSKKNSLSPSQPRRGSTKQEETTTKEEDNGLLFNRLSIKSLKDSFRNLGSTGSREEGETTTQDPPTLESSLDRLSIKSLRDSFKNLSSSNGKCSPGSPEESVSTLQGNTSSQDTSNDNFTSPQSNKEEEQQNEESTAFGRLRSFHSSFKLKNSDDGGREKMKFPTLNRISLFSSSIDAEGNVYQKTSPRKEKNGENIGGSDASKMEGKGDRCDGNSKAKERRSENNELFNGLATRLRSLTGAHSKQSVILVEEEVLASPEHNSNKFNDGQKAREGKNENVGSSDAMLKHDNDDIDGQRLHHGTTMSRNRKTALTTLMTSKSVDSIMSRDGLIMAGEGEHLYLSSSVLNASSSVEVPMSSLSDSRFFSDTSEVSYSEREFDWWNKKLRQRFRKSDGEAVGLNATNKNSNNDNKINNNTVASNSEHKINSNTSNNVSNGVSNNNNNNNNASDNVSDVTGIPADAMTWEISPEMSPPVTRKREKGSQQKEIKNHQNEQEKPTVEEDESNKKEKKIFSTFKNLTKRFR